MSKFRGNPMKLGYDYRNSATIYNGYQCNNQSQKSLKYLRHEFDLK